MLAPQAATHVHHHAGFVQLNVGIPAELDRDLRAYCRGQAVHLNFVVAAALRRHLARLRLEQARLENGEAPA
jgi:hypothetical protein